MALSDIHLPDIRPSDPLGRGVFSSGHAKRAERGVTPHQIFLEHVEADSISVDRLDYAPDTVMAEITDRQAEQRKRNFYGWAVVSVEDASRDNRSVRAAPLLDNLYHAEIELHLGEEQDRRDMQKEHANALSAVATWRARP